MPAATPSSADRHELDRALVRACVAGERSAIEHMVERMRCIARIHATLNDQRGRPFTNHDLADLSQDTALAIWQRLDTFEGRARLETWMTRFCYHHFMNEFRKMIRWRQRRETIPCPPEFGVAAVDPETLQDHEALDTGLGELGPPEADVLRLKHYEDLTFPEVARVLEISVNTAKTYYYRGLRRLEQLLRRQPIEQKMPEQNMPWGNL